MRDDPSLDHALQTATERLIDAQEVVAEAIDARTPPEPGQVDVVVHRAEDVEDLAQEAAHHADELDQSRSSSSKGLDE